MAIYANWALVFARCIIRGKDFGIQNFLVPIRDKDHKLLPGIEAGDIGPKYGFFAKDNGYMILNNVRISKKNMLRRYVKIEDGALIKKGNPKVGYATMMAVRRFLSGHSTIMYLDSILIAGKYAFARKQFKNDKK
jgi:acyl-CoA oxidase